MTIMVPGPLHPDLFGGMTPIMTEVEVRAFEVAATWVEHHGRTLTVLARDEVEAKVLARRQAVSAATGDVEDFNVDLTDEIDEGDFRVTETEIAWYCKTMGRINAQSVCSVTGRTR